MNLIEIADCLERHGIVRVNESQVFNAQKAANFLGLRIKNRNARISLRNKPIESKTSHRVNVSCGVFFNVLSSRSLLSC